MSGELRRIPRLGRRILGLHAAWGMVIWLGYPFLGEAVQGLQPLLIAAWFGTTAMFMIFGLVVAAEGWRPNETRYLASLLIFDAAALAIVVEQVRVG